MTIFIPKYNHLIYPYQSIIHAKNPVKGQRSEVRRQSFNKKDCGLLIIESPEDRVQRTEVSTYETQPKMSEDRFQMSGIQQEEIRKQRVSGQRSALQ